MPKKRSSSSRKPKSSLKKTARKPNKTNRANKTISASRSSRSSRSKSSRRTKNAGKLAVRTSQPKGTLDFFSFLRNKEKSQKNFSTNFEYGNLSFNVKSAVKGNKVTFNINIDSGNFTFSGIATLNARTFAHLHDMFDSLRSNLTKFG